MCLKAEQLQVLMQLQSDVSTEDSKQTILSYLINFWRQHADRTKRKIFTREYIDEFKFSETPALFFTQFQRSFLVWSMLEDVVVPFSECNLLGLGSLVDLGIVCDFFTLHNDVYTNSIQENNDEDGAQQHTLHVVDHIYHLNKKWRNPFKRQPLEHIRHYFGIGISSSYRWAQYFVDNLWIISILGLLTSLYGVQRQKVKALFDNCATPFFSAIVIIWGILFIEVWKRRYRNEKFVWTTRKLQRTPRKIGIIDINRQVCPNSHKITKFILRISAILLGVLLVCISNCAVIALRVFSREVLLKHYIYKIFLSDLISCVANSLLVMSLQPLLNYLSTIITNLREFSSKAKLQDSLNTTRLVLALLNHFGCTFYLAYIRKFYRGSYFFLPSNYTDSCGTNENCFYLLSLQLNILSVTQPIHRVLSDIAIPAIKEKFKSVSFKKCRSFVEENENILLDHIMAEYRRPKLPHVSALHFCDKRPVFTLLASFVDRMCDCRRLLYVFQRPLIDKVQDISAWYDVLETINYISIVNNAFLLGLTSQFGYNTAHGKFCQNIEGQLSTAPLTQNLWIIIVFQNIMFAVKIYASYISPKKNNKIKKRIHTFQNIKAV